MAKTIQLTKEFAIEMAEFPVANVTEKQGFGINGRKTDIQSFSWSGLTFRTARTQPNCRRADNSESN